MVRLNPLAPAAATSITQSGVYVGGCAGPLLFGRVGEGAATDTSFAVLHGLYWLVANLAARRPLLIAVDDAHWADAGRSSAVTPSHLGRVTAPG